MANLLVLVFLLTMLVRKFLQRNQPRVGGKVGWRRIATDAVPIPAGLSWIGSREFTVFGARPDSAHYPDLKTFMRNGTFRRPVLTHIFRATGCKTRIEMPAAAPDYERIDAAEALALLRELPDPRLVKRLHLSDELCFLDPWIRQTTGRALYHLGHATNTGIIVLYRPDRGLGGELGVTLLHEWLHLVAFKSARVFRRFRRANAIEPLVTLPIEPVWSTDAKTPTYEAWADLGEKLLGYDDEIFRKAALSLPVHAVIVWRQIESYMRAVPPLLRSTRIAEFEARTAFIRTEVAPKARAVRSSRPLWRLPTWPW